MSNVNLSGGIRRPSNPVRTGGSDKTSAKFVVGGTGKDPKSKVDNKSKKKVAKVAGFLMPSTSIIDDDQISDLEQAIELLSKNPIHENTTSIIKEHISMLNSVAMSRNEVI